jgi:hypothetical protein
MPVYGLARAGRRSLVQFSQVPGKVKRQTPKVCTEDKKKKLSGRAGKYVPLYIPTMYSPKLRRKKFNKRNNGKPQLNREKRRAENTFADVPRLNGFQPSNHRVWTSSSAIPLDNWSPEFFSDPDWQYSDHNHHQEGHPHVRLTREAAIHKRQDKAEFVDALEQIIEGPLVEQFEVY